jgi:hypothetical protein
MKARLIFSFVGRLGAMPDGRTTLVVYDAVPWTEHLDTQEIAIHTRWILFDEPLHCSIGIWGRQDSQESPLFEVARTLVPDPDEGSIARLGTVSVRLRRETLSPGTRYWIKVFGNGELTTQYPLHVADSEVELPDPNPTDLAVH